MNERDPYLTLVCSLPGFDALFAQKIPPLSRLRLNNRLQQLSAEHQQQLAIAEQILDWSSWQAGAQDPQSYAQIQRLLHQLHDPRVTQLVQEKLDLRAINAAIGYRQRALFRQQAPEGNWCVSRLRSRLEQHWLEEDFSLGQAFPWITDAVALIRAQQTLALEKLILQQAWNHLLRQSPEDEFSFFAVVIYVLKWNIAERWSRIDSNNARLRFNETLMQLCAGEKTA